ncbi:type II toxin-antitoxin system VapC family toxin [Salinispira pacifica]|uniref:PIN domain-containing protein n=1 Tax=Salinispira pacifica TaxID=1307761 RepID=V5WIK8_9SPIO|nr:hypothetical protein [Salinispira pacifica]AHC15460.1 hypothetical protein L21SP2_2093 [Salinispira pacifica]
MHRGKIIRVLLDTNIISDWLKGDIAVIHKNVPDDYVFYLPAMTLVELSSYQGLIEELIDLSLKYHFIILKPFNQLLDNELKILIDNNHTPPELFSLSQVCLQDSKRMKFYFNSEEFRAIVEQLRTDQKIGISNVYKFMINSDKKLLKEFINDYVVTQLSLLRPTEHLKLTDKYMDNDYIKDIKTLYLQAFFLYEKYQNKGDKLKDSDVFDGLIITGLPYVDIFYTEKNNFGILNDIKRKIEWLNNISIKKYTHFKTEFS